MNRTMRGFTLIELVLAIVVIGIAVTGILSVMNETTAHSADPMIEHQEIAVAEAYMEEILSKSYSIQPEQGCPGNCANRPNFDDVRDYNGLTDSQAKNELGNPVGLPNYSVSVAVAPALLGGVSALQVDVTVTGPNSTSITLTGFRTNY